MASTGRIILGCGIVGILGYLAYKAIGKASEADVLLDGLDISVTPGKPSATIVPPVVTIPINVSIFNPSKLPVSFEKPLVYVHYTMQDGSQATIAHSEPSSDKVEIKAMGVSEIRDLKLPINLMSNFGVFREIITSVFGGTFSNWTDLATFLTTVSDRLTMILPLLKVQIITRVGDLAINKTFSLA